MERAVIVILTAYAALSAISTVHGIRCYQCFTNWPGGDPKRTSPDCLSPNGTLLQPFLVDCGSPLVFQWCSTVQTDNGSLARGCNINMDKFGVKPGSCSTSKGKVMCLCDTDQCNNVAIVFAPPPPPIASVVPIVPVVLKNVTFLTENLTTSTTETPELVVLPVISDNSTTSLHIAGADNATLISEVAKLNATLADNSTTLSPVPSSTTASPKVTAVLKTATGGSSAIAMSAGIIWLVAMVVSTKGMLTAC